jgi:hypothetical protein
MKGDFPKNTRIFKHSGAVEELIRQCDTVDATTMGYGKCTVPYCRCEWYVAPNAGPDNCANNVGCGHPFGAHT